MIIRHHISRLGRLHCHGTIKFAQASRFAMTLIQTFRTWQVDEIKQMDRTRQERKPLEKSAKVADTENGWLTRQTRALLRVSEKKVERERGDQLAKVKSLWLVEFEQNKAKKKNPEAMNDKTEPTKRSKQKKRKQKERDPKADK